MTLKDMRRSAELLQVSVANHLCVPQSSISQWESGECYPHPSKISRLAELYGVTADDILAACENAKAQRPSHVLQ